uniref:Uncharacterized protein n=1 Tax=Arundo donax TaxID=35708 RepID=A0A0A9BQ20_ARUDO
MKSVLETVWPPCNSLSSLFWAILVMAFRILALAFMPLPNLVKGIFTGNDRVASPSIEKSLAWASTMVAASCPRTTEQMIPSVSLLAIGWTVILSRPTQ